MIYDITLGDAMLSPQYPQNRKLLLLIIVDTLCLFFFPVPRLVLDCHLMVNGYFYG